MAEFTKQKRVLVDAGMVKAKWRCPLCGHVFEVGEGVRWVYMNDGTHHTGNITVCDSCDGDDVKERADKMFTEAYRVMKNFRMWEQ